MAQAPAQLSHIRSLSPLGCVGSSPRWRPTKDLHVCPGGPAHGGARGMPNVSFRLGPALSARRMTKAVGTDRLWRRRAVAAGVSHGCVVHVFPLVLA